MADRVDECLAQCVQLPGNGVQELRTRPLYSAKASSAARAAASISSGVAWLKTTGRASPVRASKLCRRTLPGALRAPPMKLLPDMIDSCDNE